MPHRSFYLEVVLVLLLFVQVQTSYQLDQLKKLQILLTPGSQFQIEIPRNIDADKFMQISAFENQDTKILSSPCLLKTTQEQYFRKYGEIKHNQMDQNEPESFQKSRIWDTIEVQNEIITIFKQGKVSFISSQIFNDTNDIVLQKKKTIELNYNIQFGKFLEFRKESILKVIYMSQEGCYLVQAQNMIKLQGYDGDRLIDTIVIDGKIVVANRNRLRVYQISISQLEIQLIKQIIVYSMLQQKEIILTISSLYYDSKNNRLFLIDQYQGIKYIQWDLANQNSHLLAKDVINAQKCSQVTIVEEFLFISCSNLIVANSHSLKSLQQVHYPFHINSIIFSQRDGNLIGLGDHEFVLYLLVRQEKQLVIKQFFIGGLTNQNFQHYEYLQRTGVVILFNSQISWYGKIIPPLLKLNCAFKYIGGAQKHQQIVGTNNGKLSIFSQCNHSNTSIFHQLCERNYQIQAKIYDINKIKMTIWIVSCLAIIILAILFACRLAKYLKIKRKLQYQQLHQENTGAQKNQMALKSVQMIKIRTQ